MSFTAEVKDELARVAPACPACEKATLAALVRIEGTLFVSGPARYRVEIATDAPAAARLVVRLLHTIYALKTNLTMRRSVLHKTPNYLIEVPAQPHLADALRDMGVLSAEGGLELGIKPELSLNLFLGGLPRRYEEAEGRCKLNACLFTIDTEKKRCLSVRRTDLEE